jgi:diguanylate cyclase (GGDEF)-like protein
MAGTPRSLVRELKDFSRVAGVFAAAIGVIVLTGWAFEIAPLKSLAPGLGNMKANTAACFAFAGAALWFLGSPGASERRGRRIAIALAGVALVIAAATLSQDLFAWNAGTPELLFRDPAVGVGQPPGRMSPVAAIAFMLAAGSLPLLARRRAVPAQVLAAALGILALLTLLDYLFGATALPGGRPFVSIAPHTALAFLMLAAGLIAACAGEGWVGEFTRDTPSAAMGRALFFAGLACLPAVGWLGLKGQQAGLYAAEFGLALTIITSVVVLAVLIGVTAHAANIAEGRTRHLDRVHAVLSRVNSVIVRVDTREVLFAECCRIAIQEGGFPFAWIGVVDRDAMRVTIAASAGDDRGFLDLVRERLTLIDPFEQLGPTARAVLAKKPVVVNDIESETVLHLRNAALERGIRSAAFLPLIVSGEAAAALALYADAPGFFDEEEMALLAELAGDIAFALDHLQKAQRLEYLAFYDSLTGLANRALFHERLEQRVYAAQGEKHKLAVGILDIERFRTINDTLGRHVGDELLKQVAQRLAAFPGDLTRIARVSGDRFGVMVPGVKGEEEVARYVEEGNRQCFRLPFRVNGSDLRISAKMGVAIYPNDGGDADTLYAKAEAALKNAKTRGEKYLFHTQAMTEKVAETLNLENKLRQALERDEFVLHYQPKVNLETRRIEGVEALLRWKSPDLGLVSPRQFIPLLEDTGLILEVGIWALRKAATEHRRCVEQGLPAPLIAVKVSPIQLRQADFVDTLRKALAAGAPTPGIDLEISENIIMGDIDASIDKLAKAHDLGVNIAIDHFGTGYSSLGYLAKLPVQALKIDRSFVFRMLEDPSTMTVVSTIISLAHSLAMSVTADGVETEEQAKMLRLLRCDAMQGYVISKPLSSEEMDRFLQQPGPASLH